MIKNLSVLIAITTLTTSSFATENIVVREQNVNKCKKSSQSKGDYLIKECSNELSFNNKIVIAGVSFKGSKRKKKSTNRLELLILDKRGANHYMANGVANSTFEPSGTIEIVKTDSSDRAVIYRLDYSAYDSEKSFFKIITVRLRSSFHSPNKTCVVGVSDSKDSLEDGKDPKSLEKDFRNQAKDFISNSDFADADCVESDHGH